MVFASIEEGNTTGYLWIGETQRADPMVLLWDQGNNVFYLSGEDISQGVIIKFAALVGGEIRHRAIDGGLANFRVHALNESMEPRLPDLFYDIELTKTNRLFYTFQGSGAYSVLASALENVGFELIDGEFLMQDHRENHQHVVEEIDWMWTTRERYVEKGFGIAGVLVNAIAGWCTAEYVSSRHCGIGIETLPQYQGQGLATEMAARFVNHSLQQGLTPHWECDSEHAASIRVAEKVGFELIDKVTFWYGSFLRQA
jgi:RimJ/RimL family protein N-acetyltransferase